MTRWAILTVSGTIVSCELLLNFEQAAVGVDQFVDYTVHTLHNVILDLVKRLQ